MTSRRSCLVGAVGLLAAVGAASPAVAQHDRQRLVTAAEARAVADPFRQVEAPAGLARLFFVRPPRSIAPALGIELRFSDGSSAFLAPGAFVSHDERPDTAVIHARSLWGYVQAITFTRDHGTSTPMASPDPGLPGPCCPRALMHELTRRHQRLSVLNWEAQRLLWQVPEDLAADARTETVILAYQKRGVKTQVLDLEIGAAAGELLFFRVRVEPAGAITVEPLSRRAGARRVRRAPLTAVRFSVDDEQRYTAPAGFPRQPAPETSRRIMEEGLLAPLGARQTLAPVGPAGTPGSMPDVDEEAGEPPSP
ncbi:MAG: hypothetical protein ACE5IK_13430 [Acidobacteriota bacterium]